MLRVAVRSLLRLKIGSGRDDACRKGREAHPKNSVLWFRTIKATLGGENSTRHPHLTAKAVIGWKNSLCLLPLCFLSVSRHDIFV